MFSFELSWMILDEFCIAHSNLSLCFFLKFPILPKVLRELMSPKVARTMHHYVS